MGFLSNVHNILPSVYSLWYSHVTGRTPPPPPSAANVSGPSYFDVIMDDIDAPTGVRNDIHDVPDAPAVDAKSATPTEETPSKASPEENLKTKTIAMNFVSIPFLPSITSGIRMMCAPVFDFMHGSLEVG